MEKLSAGQLAALGLTDRSKARSELEKIWSQGAENRALVADESRFRMAELSYRIGEERTMFYAKLDSDKDIETMRIESNRKLQIALAELQGSFHIAGARINAGVALSTAAAAANEKTADNFQVAVRDARKSSYEALKGFASKLGIPGNPQSGEAIESWLFGIRSDGRMNWQKLAEDRGALGWQTAGTGIVNMRAIANSLDELVASRLMSSSNPLAPLLDPKIAAKYPKMRADGNFTPMTPADVLLLYVNSDTSLGRAFQRYAETVPIGTGENQQSLWSALLSIDPASLGGFKGQEDPNRIKLTPEEEAFFKTNIQGL